MVHWPAQSSSSPLGVRTIHKTTPAMIPKGQRPSWGKDLGLIPPPTLLFFLMNPFVIVALFEALLGLQIDGEPADEGIVIHILPFIAEFKNDLILIAVGHKKPPDVIFFESGQELFHVLRVKKEFLGGLFFLRGDLFR